MFMKDTCLWYGGFVVVVVGVVFFFFFLVPFLFGFSIRVIPVSQKVWGGVPSSFLREIEHNCHYFFLKC